MEDSIVHSSLDSGRSLWRRKSGKRQTRASATTLLSSSSSSLPTMDPGDDDDGPRSSQENLSFTRSIIPDPLGELPAWLKRETEMAAANTSTFRIKYPLHNPNGPRWYKNHHLLPPAHLNRPPSLFSPSFPPMAASVDLSEDSTRLPGLSRTPSGTPLPTPSSSQVRIPDPTKPRSRKASQDNVDLMDVSDPWGTHWHHQSPYDAGSSISPVSVDSPDGPPRTRSRLSSTNTAQARRKTVTPSPLSQSTSALHLQATEPTHLTRKLSKRRKPILTGLFGAHEKGTPEDPGTSAENRSSSLPKRMSVVANGTLHLNFGGSKRHSTLSPMSNPVNGSSAALSSHSSDKRQSVLGRLVRKFSILRRLSQEPGTTVNEGPEGIPGASLSAVDEQSSRRSLLSQRQPSPEKPVAEKKASDPSKRIPPPRIDLDMEPQILKGPSIEVERETSDRTSTISYDVPFSPLGKLMIANPDAPSSGATTPIKMSNTLPPEAPLQDASANHLHPADRQQVLKPSSVPSSSGKSSPIPGLLSPISVAVPAITFPDVAQFMATARSATPPIAIPPSTSSSGIRLSTSAPAETFIPPHTIGDLSPPRSSPSPIKDAPRPISPYLAPPVVDDPSLSRASVLVNPPTPYNTDEPHSALPVFPRVSTDHSAVSRQSQDVSFPKQVSPTQEADDRLAEGGVRLTKSNSTMSRKTETYRLVRTQSDKVSSSSEAAFQAQGEQWLLVNSDEAPRRRRTRDKAENSERIGKASSRTPRERDRGGRGGRDRERAREKAWDGERGRDGERERERERERDRDRERERERERERDKEMERERRREREWEREREKEKERERKRGRERERDREREREKVRERERAWEREREREREKEKERERARQRQREKEEERERRRRQEKAVQQGDQRRTTSHTTAKLPTVEKNDSGSLSGRPGRARSLDTPQRPTVIQPMMLALQGEPPRHRKSDDRPDSVHQQGQPKTARSGPSPIVTVARVDHLPPVSARPTSELTSAADMNALKAREAWEMDRLWKGRSLVQGQRETSVISSPSKAINETAKDTFSIQSFAHGSSHTSYVVQPLQAHPIPASVFYANMPAAPPPIIYAATSPYGQPHPSSSRDYTTYHSLSNSFTFPSKVSSVDLPIRPNPLPVPPRESSYQPAQLPVLTDRSSGSASDYWGDLTHMPSRS